MSRPIDVQQIGKRLPVLAGGTMMDLHLKPAVSVEEYTEKDLETMVGFLERLQGGEAPFPIRDLPGFHQWVAFNKFQAGIKSGRKGDYVYTHDGFDFTSYMRDDGTMVFGLPDETPVYAIAPGVVRYIRDGGHDNYHTGVSIEHTLPGGTVMATYHHMNPEVEEGQEVGPDTKLGTIFYNARESGQQPHIHFSLRPLWDERIQKTIEIANEHTVHYWNEPGTGRYNFPFFSRDFMVDTWQCINTMNPEVLWPELERPETVPQGTPHAKILELGDIDIYHTKRGTTVNTGDLIGWSPD